MWTLILHNHVTAEIESPRGIARSNKRARTWTINSASMRKNGKSWRRCKSKWIGKWACMILMAIIVRPNPSRWTPLLSKTTPLLKKIYQLESHHLPSNSSRLNRLQINCRAVLALRRKNILATSTSKENGLKTKWAKPANSAAKALISLHLREAWGQLHQVWKLPNT